MYPIWLVQLGGVSVDIFGVEMVMGGGYEGFVIDYRFFIWDFPRQRILNWLDIINISIFLLLSRAYFFVVLLKLLCGGESW